MSDLAPRQPIMERLLAGVLNYGTWLASAVIGVGLTLAWLGSRASPPNLATPPAMPVVTAGIAMLILLPVLRVALMLIVFVRQRDYRFGAIAALVLAIIFAGCVLGAR